MYYIATTTRHDAIHGIGRSAQEAIEDASSSAGVDPELAGADYIVYPASDLLYSEVLKRGGFHLDWSVLDGIAVLNWETRPTAAPKKSEMR